MSHDSILYSRVTRPADRQEILLRLVEEKGEVMIAGDQPDQTIEAQVTSYHIPEERLGLSVPSPAALPAQLMVRFQSLGGALAYLICDRWAQQGEGLQLFLKEADIYIEQKRKDFRLTIPDAYPSTFQFEKESSGEASREGKLLDLSVNGLSFHLGLESSPLKVGDLLRATMTLGARPSLSVIGQVRFVRPDEPSGQQVGLEFDHQRMGNEDAVLELIAFYRADLFDWKRTS